MERKTNWKPNELGGDSIANNPSDWRSQHEPDLRKRVLSKIVEKLREYFPKHSQNKINLTAVTFEEKTYGIAKDKGDYLRKLSDKMRITDKRYKNVQLGSSVNGTKTPDPAAQALNQTQSLTTSVPYTETSTSQQWLPQNTQSSVNVPGFSGLPTQVPITVSGAQNLNTYTSEGVHINLFPGSDRQMQGRQQLLPQQQPQNSNYMFQHLMNQQLLKEKIRHGDLRPPHIQQQAQPPQQQHHQKSLLKQPTQQQLTHQISLSQPIQQSLPQASALSSLPSSGQQNSYFLPRHQFPTQWVSSSHQQQMAVLSQEEKQEKQEKQEQLISQLMNGPDTQQKHLTSRQNNGEQQRAFMVSLSQQNNIVSFQAMAQQNMHQQCLNNASALPSQQKQNMPCGQSSLLGIQGQEVGQSQPMKLQQYHPQHPAQQQPQRFHGAGSLHQTQNIPDQQNQPSQLQRASLANPSTSQDSTCKTVNASGADWEEETYQKIQALKEMYLPILTTMFQKITEKLRQIESLLPQKMESDPTEKLKAAKSNIQRVMVFLNVQRSTISEKHKDKFSAFEEHILWLTKSQTKLQRPMQQQQGQLPQSQSPQVHVSQSLDKNQMSSRLMPSNQNAASFSISGLTTSQTTMPHSLQIRPNMEPRNENNIMAYSGNVASPSLKQDPASNPHIVHSNLSSVQSNMLQQQQQQQKPFHQQQQQLQQPQKAKQQLQMPTLATKMNDAKMRQRVNIKAELLQQYLSSSQRQLLKPLASPAQIQHQSSPQLVDQQILPETVYKTETPSKSGGSSFVAPSPSPENLEIVISVVSTVPHAQSTLDSSVKLGTEEQPLLSLPPEPITEQPIDRLIKALQSSSPKSLAESVSEISSVISMVDRIAGSFHPSGRSRACLGEDLSARNLITDEETNPSKRLKRSISTLPREIKSQIDSYKQFSSMESEVDSTASSGSKVNKIEPGCALLQEIKEINGRLIETVVEICDEDTSGTIVMCSYSPVALSATFKDHYNSGKISQIQPLRLLVPANYPYSNPILLEEIPIDASVHKYEDLSARTRSRFSFSMKELSERVSLKEIAQTWNDCARATMVEYAARHGGGTFSSKYGAWDTVLRAS